MLAFFFFMIPYGHTGKMSIRPTYINFPLWTVMYVVDTRWADSSFKKKYIQKKKYIGNFTYYTFQNDTKMILI